MLPQQGLSSSSHSKHQYANGETGLPPAQTIDQLIAKGYRLEDIPQACQVKRHSSLRDFNGLNLSPRGRGVPGDGGLPTQVEEEGGGVGEPRPNSTGTLRKKSVASLHRRRNKHEHPPPPPLPEGDGDDEDGEGEAFRPSFAKMGSAKWTEGLYQPRRNTSISQEEENQWIADIRSQQKLRPSKVTPASSVASSASGGDDFVNHEPLPDIHSPVTTPTKSDSALRKTNSEEDAYSSDEIKKSSRSSSKERRKKKKDRDSKRMLKVDPEPQGNPESPRLLKKKSSKALRIEKEALSKDDDDDDVMPLSRKKSIKKIFRPAPTTNAIIEEEEDEDEEEPVLKPKRKASRHLKSKSSDSAENVSNDGDVIKPKRKSSRHLGSSNHSSGKHRDRKLKSSSGHRSRRERSKSREKVPSHKVLDDDEDEDDVDIGDIDLLKPRKKASRNLFASKGAGESEAGKKDDVRMLSRRSRSLKQSNDPPGELKAQSSSVGDKDNRKAPRKIKSLTPSSHVHLSRKKSKAPKTKHSSFDNEDDDVGEVKMLSKKSKSLTPASSRRTKSKDKKSKKKSRSSSKDEEDDDAYLKRPSSDSSLLKKKKKLGGSSSSSTKRKGKKSAVLAATNESAASEPVVETKRKKKKDPLNPENEDYLLRPKSENALSKKKRAHRKAGGSEHRKEETADKDLSLSPALADKINRSVGSSLHKKPNPRGSTDSKGASSTSTKSTVASTDFEDFTTPMSPRSRGSRRDLVSEVPVSPLGKSRSSSGGKKKSSSEHGKPKSSRRMKSEGASGLLGRMSRAIKKEK